MRTIFPCMAAPRCCLVRCGAHPGGCSPPVPRRSSSLLPAPTDGPRRVRRPVLRCAAAMPASKIDREVVLHVAKLASLSLSEAEVDRFAVELARIVAHVEQLEAIDTRDVPPTAHVQVDRIALR